MNHHHHRHHYHHHHHPHTYSSSSLSSYNNGSSDDGLVSEMHIRQRYRETAEDRKYLRSKVTTPVVKFAI